VITAAAVSAAKPIGFVDYLQSQLTVPTLEDLAKKLAVHIKALLPGQTIGEQEAYATKQALVILEAFDNRIPVLGQWMDSPVADFMEEWIVGLVIHWAFLAVLGIEHAAAAGGAK